MNIKKYPEIQKAVNEYKKLGKEMEKLYSKIEALDKKGKEDKNLSKQFDNLRAETIRYKTKLLPEIAFKCLSKTKPAIINKNTKQTFKWDELFNCSLNELLKDPKKCMILTGIVLGLGQFDIN